MKQAQETFSIQTSGQNLYEFGRDVDHWILQTGISCGLLTLFCRHTSASLTVQENADPDVQLDLRDFFAALVPETLPGLRHTSEGPDDMPAHIKSALSDVSLSIPVSKGRMVLGTWQGIYLFEHRTQAHRRTVIAHLIGD